MPSDTGREKKAKKLVRLEGNDITQARSKSQKEDITDDLALIISRYINCRITED
jgi:hypothetical protein